jgi:hypothetical protein
VIPSARVIGENSATTTRNVLGVRPIGTSLGSDRFRIFSAQAESDSQCHEISPRVRWGLEQSGESRRQVRNALGAGRSGGGHPLSSTQEKWVVPVPPGAIGVEHFQPRESGQIKGRAATYVEEKFDLPEPIAGFGDIMNIERGRSTRPGPVRSLPIRLSVSGSSQRGKICARPDPGGLASWSGRREHSGQETAETTHFSRVPRSG